MPRRRNPDRTRARILGAALDEFSRHGPAGARVDRIATAAGVNKRMIYHYFGSKDGLWTALLKDQLTEQAVLADLADAGDLAQRLEASSAQIVRRPEPLRLLAWHALTDPDDDMTAIGLDGQNLRLRGVDVMTGPAVAGGQLELMLAALVLFPVAFPQLTRMMTGHEPRDSEFVRQRAAFFAWLAERLAVRLAERLVDTDPAAIKHADDPARAEPAPVRKPRLRLTAAVTEDRSG